MPDSRDVPSSMPHTVQDFQVFLDFIAKHEGTADQPGGGYNTSLGYGAYTGGEKSLSTMTLAEIDKLQTEMLNNRRNKFNSSALGRYQIVRTTLRGLRQKLDYSGSDIYSPDLQDRLAVALILGRGPNPRGLRQEWASLSRVSDSDILHAYYARENPWRDIETGRDQEAGDFIAKLLAQLRGSGSIPQRSEILLSPPDSGSQVKDLQQALIKRNYHLGKVDGIYGTLTKGAVAAFQADFHVATENIGLYDVATRDALAVAGNRPLDASRIEVTAGDLIADGSVIAKRASNTKLTGLLSMILGALGLGTTAVTTYTGLTTLPASSPTVAPTVAKAIGVTKDMLADTLARASVADLQALMTNLKLNQAQVTSIINNAKIVAFNAVQGGSGAVPPSAPPSSAVAASNLLGDIIPILTNIVVPGGGSLAIIALGALTQIFGSRILQQRVQDQRQGANISAMGTSSPG